MILSSRQGYESKCNTFSTTVYKCPMYFRCRCVCKMQITVEPDVTILERYGIHTADSHSEDHSKYLKRGQIDAIRHIVRGDPLMAPSKVRRNLKNFDRPVQVPSALSSSLKRLVAKERQEVLSVFLDGVEMDNSFACMEKLGQKKWLKTKGQMHNDPDNDYHMSDPHEVVVIGKSFDVASNRIHLNFTTPSNLCNLLRALAAGWNVTVAGDGLYGLCKMNFGMIMLSAVSLGGHHHPICYAIVPGETTEAWRQTWRGVRTALFYLITKIKLCDNRNCKFCTMLHGCLAERHVQAWLKTDQFKERINFPVDIAISDQTKSWPKWVREEFDGAAKSIPCDIHARGIARTRKSALKHFTGPQGLQMHEEMYVLWARATRTPYETMKSFVQRKFVQWLRHVKQRQAATWFMNYHTGEGLGNWTNGDVGIGSTLNNMGLERAILEFKTATVNANLKQNSGMFVASTVKFVGDKSEESLDKLTQVAGGPFSFPKQPITDKLVYDKVQSVHPFTLCLTTLEKGPASRAFRVFMNNLYHVCEPHKLRCFRKLCFTKITASPLATICHRHPF